MATFVSLNVNGLRDPNKRLSFLQWLSHSAADFVCLQEVHAVSCAECQRWFSPFGYLCVFSPGSSRSGGTALLYRPNYEIVRSTCDKEGRFVLAEFRWRTAHFRLVTVYAPNRNPERDSFFEYVRGQIDTLVPTIICGDFNTVWDRRADRRGSDPTSTGRESSSVLHSLFQDIAAVDVWRKLHPDTRSFSWTRPDGSIASRIDLFGFPLAWTHLVLSCDIVPCPFSDHDAVFLVTSLPEPFPKGPGRWFFNISLLRDPSFVEAFNFMWSSWRAKKPGFPTLQAWWDRGKEHIKRMAISFSSEKRSFALKSRDILTTLAAHLKVKIDAGAVSLLEVYSRVLNKLAAFDRADAEGARVRSRVQWAEEGEMSSRFFLRMERKRAAESWISAMRLSDGKIVSDISGICRSWSDYYSSLFSAESVDLQVQEGLFENLTARLPADAASSCEGPLSVQEVRSALEGMARGKSPGSDGLPMEFYLTFWDIIGPDLTTVLNDSFDGGLLPLSQRTALISLIFKKGDRLEHKNWRPISLLNVDYKICTRTVAGRLLNVLHHVILPNQTCGVKGRFIGENVTLLRDVVDFASETGRPVAILSLDQEKAFDRVDWGFLFKTLTHMGFGPSFIKWVQLFYNKIRSAVLVDGYRSGFFFPSRGVRQGCPLSPLLYVISIEVLAAALRANSDISGLKPSGLCRCLPTISLYADDTSVITSSDSAIRATFSTYDLFERGTGSKLNLAKCRGLWLGSWRGRQDPPVAIQWTSGMIKILGIFIGHGDLEVANWMPRIEAVEKCLASWRGRALSFSGRAVVLNALALSRIWYVASLVFLPSWALTRLNSAVFGFFWAGKRELVARNVVRQPKDKGGFSVVSIESKIFSLLVQWVRRLEACPNGWVYLLTYWLLDRYGLTIPIALSGSVEVDWELLPPFYCSLFQAWTALKGSWSPTTGFSFGSPAVGGPFPILNASCKSCYLTFVESTSVQPHCVAKFGPQYGPLDWESIWTSLSFMPLDRKVEDLSWKIAHGVLYTAERLNGFGYSVPLSCFCGSPLESLDHLLFLCPLAQSGLSWIQSLLFAAAPRAPLLDIKHVLFGFSRDDLRSVPRVFSYLLGVCKMGVWCQRNDFRFRGIRPSAVRLLFFIRSRVRFYLPLFSKRFHSVRRRRYFDHQWGGNGAIGRFFNGVFNFSELFNSSF